MSSIKAFVRYDDPKVEPPVSLEDENIQALQETIKRVINRNFSHHRHGMRGTHVKTQGMYRTARTLGQTSRSADSYLPQESSRARFQSCPICPRTWLKGCSASLRTTLWRSATPTSPASCRTTARPARGGAA